MSSGVFSKITGYYNRKPNRMRGYDYSHPGYYFITMCVHDRKKMVFGEIMDGRMMLNALGEIAFRQWQILPDRFPCVIPDTFQIMPNHIHAVLSIDISGDIESISGKRQRTGASPVPTKNPENKNAENTAGYIPKIITPTIGEIIGSYKSLVAIECLNLYKSRNKTLGKLWQRSYYDRIVRIKRALYPIRKYIRDNPRHWNHDSNQHIEDEIVQFGLTERP